MRYRFRGLLRETGKPVEGHVEAPDTEQAYALMSDNGIVCESLREDPRMGDYTSPATAPGTQGPAGPHNEVASAIDSALDTSSTQVNVDDLWRKYRGQRVRVIDRDKIRNRVMNVVSSAIRQTGVDGEAGADGQNKTLERVEEALTKMFGDNKNLTSELSPQQTALEDQINRLTGVVLQMEKSMAAMTMAMRRGGGGGYGGGGSTGRLMKQVKDPKNDKVLLEIFETNLDLQRGSKNKTAQPPVSAPAGDNTSTPQAPAAATG